MNRGTSRKTRRSAWRHAAAPLPSACQTSERLLKKKKALLDFFITKYNWAHDKHAESANLPRLICWSVRIRTAGQLMCASVIRVGPQWLRVDACADHLNTKPAGEKAIINHPWNQTMLLIIYTKGPKRAERFYFSFLNAPDAHVQTKDSVSISVSTGHDGLLRLWATETRWLGRQEHKDRVLVSNLT